MIQRTAGYATLGLWVLCSAPVSAAAPPWTLPAEGQSHTALLGHDICLHLSCESCEAPLTPTQPVMPPGFGRLELALTIEGVSAAPRVTQYRKPLATGPKTTAAAGFITAPGHHLLAAELCGEDAFFGPAGERLTLDFDRREPQRWSWITELGGQEWSWQGDGD
ncbi:MAG: hypothetical protein AAGF94_03115 [Pseudomonadota bacterium]